MLSAEYKAYVGVLVLFSQEVCCGILKVGAGTTYVLSWAVMKGSVACVGGILVGSKNR